MLYLRDIAFAPRSWALLVRNLVVAVALLALSMFTKYPHAPRTVAYNFIREVVKLQTELRTRSWISLTAGNFYIRYRPQDAQVAGMVLDAAKEAFEPVNRLLGFSFEERIPIVLYPDRAALNRSFGWDADQNAMGVYWAGVIRILSPNAWVSGETEAEKERNFKKNGPMAHEYAHLVVDYQTGGNYPRWLTEGIAQYVEREVTGFQFRVPVITGAGQLYPLAKMDSQFDLLPSQSVAYWQSLAMVEFMLELEGVDGLRQLLAALGSGKTFKAAFGTVYGIAPEQMREQFAQRSVRVPSAGGPNYSVIA